MAPLKPIGIVCLNEETGERVFFPVSGEKAPKPKGGGKIVKNPTPEEVAIKKKKDDKWQTSLKGVLGKHKQRHKPDLPENPVQK